MIHQEGVPPHEECAPRMRELMDNVQRKSARDLDLPGELQGHVIISTLRVVAPGLSEESVVCPHGVRYWIAPDAEMQRSLKELVGIEESS